MPSTSKKQAKFMAAAAHNPAFAKKVGISQGVAKEFNQADKGKKFKEGGAMKHSDIKEDKPMMKKVAAEAVKGHEKRMHKMAKGGVTRADGIVKKGHTKGKTIAMCGGGMAKGKK
jgi:hypothetical protein